MTDNNPTPFLMAAFGRCDGQFVDSCRKLTAKEMISNACTTVNCGISYITVFAT